MAKTKKCPKCDEIMRRTEEDGEVVYYCWHCHKFIWEEK